MFALQSSFLGWQVEFMLHASAHYSCSLSFGSVAFLLVITGYLDLLKLDLDLSATLSEMCKTWDLAALYGRSTWCTGAS